MPNEYSAMIFRHLEGKPDLPRLVALAKVPEVVRGYGHVKEKALAKAQEREAKLLAAFRSPSVAATAAE